MQDVAGRLALLEGARHQLDLEPVVLDGVVGRAHGYQVLDLVLGVRPARQLKQLGQLRVQRPLVDLLLLLLLRLGLLLRPFLLLGLFLLLGS